MGPPAGTEEGGGGGGLRRGFDFWSTLLAVVRLIGLGLAVGGRAAEVKRLSAGRVELVGGVMGEGLCSGGVGVGEGA